MRQRQPHGSQLQQTRGQRVEHAARNIDMGNRVTIEQKAAALRVVEKRRQRHKDSDAGHAGRAAVGNGGSLCSHSTLTVR